MAEAEAGPEAGASSGEAPALAAKIKALVERRKPKPSLRASLQASGESQISAGDAAAWVLKKSGRTVGGSTCQIAGDDRSKLIGAEEVGQGGNEAGQMEPRMTKAGAAMGAERLTGLADSGSFSGEQLKSCADKGLDIYVPIPRQPPRRGKGDVM